MKRDSQAKSKKRHPISEIKRIHQEKVRSRREQILARKQGKSYDGFSIAKHVNPGVFTQPLDLSRVKFRKPINP